MFFEASKNTGHSTNGLKLKLRTFNNKQHL